MASFDTSASQRRAMTVLGIAFDVNDSYETAAYKLQVADAPGDGVPSGHNWRSAKKLSDAELLVALRASSVRASRERYEAAMEIIADYHESMR